MAAVRRVTNRRLTLLAELKYWRGIMLDFPARKIEALQNIDSLLDEMLAGKS